MKVRSPLRVWVNVTSGVWNPVYTWHCPACGVTPLAPAYSPGAGGTLPQPTPLKYVRRSAIRDAANHTRTCPAMRLARLEAELESEIAWQEEAAKYARDLSWTNSWWLGVADTRLNASRRLTAILARHRQASNA